MDIEAFRKAFDNIGTLRVNLLSTAIIAST